METVKELAKILEECDCKHSVEHCDTCPYIGEEDCLSYFETAKKLVEHGVTIVPDTNVGNKWVKTSERIPTKEDADKLGQVLVYIDITDVVYNTFWCNVEPEIHAYWRKMPGPPKGVQ